MKFLNALTCFAFGTSAVVAAPAPDFEAQDNLPGLNSLQTRHARAIMAKVKAVGVGSQGCQAAIATGLVESRLQIYANKKVPESLKYAHDLVGSDHDSVGIFQQRVSIYKNIACDMDAECSTGEFLAEMKRIKGWRTMAVGTLCQRVQRSAYPDRYAKRVGDAQRICAAGGL